MVKGCEVFRSDAKANRHGRASIGIWWEKECRRREGLEEYGIIAHSACLTAEYHSSQAHSRTEMTLQRLDQFINDGLPASRNWLAVSTPARGVLISLPPIRPSLLQPRCTLGFGSSRPDWQEELAALVRHTR